MGSLPQTSSSTSSQLHFLLFPFMAQGHMIPMVDIGKLLVRRGSIVTIVTTPVNAARFKSALELAKDSGLSIQLVELRFPCVEAGIPEGCESYDMLPNPKDMAMNFFKACSLLEDQAEALFQQLSPRPSCIISDMCLPYTLRIANKFKVPRINFHGFCSFALFCVRTLQINKELIDQTVTSETEYFVLPGMPQEIQFTLAQLPFRSRERNSSELIQEIVTADLESFGVVLNSFQELEQDYVEAYQKARGRGKAWCIGPVSLCNEDDLDKAQRGNNLLSDGPHQSLMNWLDSQEPSSVLYVCFGSLCNLIPTQLIELGLGLEASGKPFIWALRANGKLREVDNWIEENKFEDRIKGRGILIRGWSPQVLILSHQAIGGFLTHCGWNSTLEGITAGLPLITWPLFADQFCNEMLVVHVLRIGVSVGVEHPVRFGEEEQIGVQVKKDDVKKAVGTLMDETEEGKARRARAREFGNLARKAVEQGGSSYLNLTMLMEGVKQQIAKLEHTDI